MSVNWGLAGCSFPLHWEMGSKTFLSQEWQKRGQSRFLLQFFELLQEHRGFAWLRGCSVTTEFLWVFLHCYSIFDLCSSSSLSSASPGLIPITLPSYIQATLPILLFLRWSCPALGDGELRHLGHEASPQPSCFPAAFLGKIHTDLL